MQQRLMDIKKCAGYAKTRLHQEKRQILRIYTLEEYAKVGISEPLRDNKIIEGEPTGKERQILMQKARSIAQNKLRKEFYDIYQKFYEEELGKLGIEEHLPALTRVTKIQKLEEEIKRLKGLLEKCTC
jgi:hypothetical protein